MNFVDHCRKAISFDTTNEMGTIEYVKWLSSICQEFNLAVDIQNEYLGDIEHANIMIRPNQQRGDSEFLLQAHMDTPDPGPYPLWDKTGSNPFDATIIDEEIYGIGSAEVKLDLICKIHALASFQSQTSWKLHPVVVGTYGEESGMQGALKLIRKNKISPKMALIGEPSNLRLITAAKGFAGVEIRIPFTDEEINYREQHNLRESTTTQSKMFTGVSAHSSVPHLGDSAINKMLEYLIQLPENLVIMEMDGGTNFNTVASHAFLEVEGTTMSGMVIGKKIAEIYRTIRSLMIEFHRYEDSTFQPSHPTLNIGLIRTFEDHILISGSCRMPPMITQQIYEEWILQLKNICDSNQAQFRVTDYKKPFRTAENSLLVKGCLDIFRKMGMNDEPTTQPSTNESSIFARLGVDCVCFGPGVREGNIHMPNEKVSIQQLRISIEFYKNVIERFCL